MSHLLVVDDEPHIRELIRKYAQFDNHQVSEAKNGIESIELLQQNPNRIDIVIMDVMMPEMDGFTALREIRKFSNVPVLMLTARGEEYDRIHGFEAGTDDYIVKPFSPKELMLRIQSILRRSQPNHNHSHDVYQYNDLFIDFSAYKVTIANQPINLTPKELELLFYMVKNRNLALTRDQILNQVWGFDFYGDDRTLDTHIKRLRKSLRPYDQLIVTLRGLGYRFDDGAQQ